MEEPLSFDMAHGTLDDNGSPFLKWRFNYSYKHELQKGDEEYFYSQGYAKRRDSPTSPIIVLSQAERECLHAVDIADGEYAAQERQLQLIRTVPDWALPK